MNPDPDAFQGVRNYKGSWQEARFDIAGRSLNVAVAHGLKNVRQLCEAIRNREVRYETTDRKSVV